MLLSLCAFASAALALPVQETESDSTDSALMVLCAQFSGHDFDRDGRAEIDQLRLLQDEEGSQRPLVLVLVEQRLLEPLDGAADLHPPLQQLRQDLTVDGWDSALLSVALPASVEHRDGLVLLALREFLRGVRQERDLAGVLLVGRFPDAYLVRTCNWRKKEDLVLHRGSDAQRSYSSTPFVRRVPEPVAHRADIVLADLDGHWEDLYVGPRVELPAVYAVFPDGVPQRGGACVDVQQSGIAFEDFFHVRDGMLEVAPLVKPAEGEAAWVVRVFDDHGDLECTPADRAFPNALARPEIHVSRIDPSGIALSPDPGLTDADGVSLMGEDGQVQSLRFASAEAVPAWNGELWVADPLLERRLLADFLERNHAFREGPDAAAFRPASIACDLGSGYARMRRASPAWKDLSEATADVHGRPDLTDFVDWLQLPAVLRTVRAHSDPWGSVFRRADTAALDAYFTSTPTGGPLSWTPQGERLVPSLQKAAGGGKLDFFLLRSIWESGLASETSSLYLHTGCHGISPPGAANRPFDHPNYGLRGGGEALLFFGGGLAMVGRAKVFYDEPRGFAEELAAGGTIGHAWARYYAEEGASTWSKAGGDIGRKRSYFWSVLGDWTLRCIAPH